MLCAVKALATGGNMNKLVPVGEGDGPMGPSRLLLSKPVIAAVSGYAGECASAA